MPTVLVENPIAAVIVVVLLVTLGWGGRGFVLNFRKDKRDAASSDIEVLKALVHEVAREEIKAVADRAEQDRDYYDKELRTARRRVGRLEGRVDQLTNVLQQNGIPVPGWLTEPVAAQDPL